ncbi:hypothetical protein ACQ86N_27850 [Puia sp. P3]|uniref:hypothetical protein n=1 Tax=Puia sp. P3 TaxID=3423952 RepID=UPI003D6790A6
MGTREILMTRLMREDQPLGFIHLHTDRPGSFTPEFRNVMQRIAPQLSGAVCNILMNEEILSKEKEKSFLLDLSSDIAKVRTKDDLAEAIRRSLTRMNAIKGYVIRRINEDGATHSAYIWQPGASKMDKKTWNTS